MQICDHLETPATLLCAVVARDAARFAPYSSSGTGIIAMQQMTPRTKLRQKCDDVEHTCGDSATPSNRPVANLRPRRTDLLRTCAPVELACGKFAIPSRPLRCSEGYGARCSYPTVCLATLRGPPLRCRKGFFFCLFNISQNSSSDPRILAMLQRITPRPAPLSPPSSCCVRARTSRWSA